MHVLWHCVYCQTAFATQRNLASLPDSYITPTKNISNCTLNPARLRWISLNEKMFLFIQCAVCLTNQLHDILASAGPVPSLGPWCVTRPLLLHFPSTSGKPWLCFDWDLCHLWLLNPVVANFTMHGLEVSTSAQTVSYPLFNTNSELLLKLQLISLVVVGKGVHLIKA